MSSTRPTRMAAVLLLSGVLLRALIVLAAFGAVVYGTWEIYRPAAYIVGGGLVLMEVARGRSRREG